MLASLDSEHDSLARNHFSRVYTVLYVFVNMGWDLIRSFQEEFVEEYCEVLVEYYREATEASCAY